MYDTVIFDMDGTLLNTLDDLTDAVNFMCGKYGFPKQSVSNIRAHVGNGLKNLTKLSIPEGENNPMFEEFLEEFVPYYRSHCMVKTRPYDGIPELIEELKNRKIKMAVVSNKAHSAVTALNDQIFGLQVAIGENEKDGIKKKPAPDMVEMALLKLGSSKSGALYVGDSEVDAETAKNSGLPCVLCSWGFRDMDVLTELEALTIINFPAELLDIL